MFRAFSEMDLRHLQHINKVIVNKTRFTKADLGGELELDSIIAVYGEETFFTIFAEQAPIYDLIFT